MRSSCERRVRAYSTFCDGGQFSWIVNRVIVGSNIKMNGRGERTAAMRMRWYSFRRRDLRSADWESRLYSRRVRRRERLRILRSGDVGAVDEIWGKVVRVIFALPDLLRTWLGKVRRLML